MIDRGEFIRRNTVVAALPLVPEIRLSLASEVTPLWQATEAVLAQSGLPPPFWAFAWAGGQALLDHPEFVAGQRVLDFGAGSGLVAIAAAKAGAACVTAAETDPFAAAAIAMNAALNAVAVSIVSRDLLAGGAVPAADVVTAGDVCYERPMAERATDWLRAAAGAGALVLLGDPGRAYLPADGLRRLCRHAVPTSLEIEDCAVRETTVWQVLPPAPI
jgi:predicted nicotinamide N-methyase